MDDENIVTPPPVVEEPTDATKALRRYETVPLPAKTDLHRKLKVRLSLNDLVEPIFLELYDDPEFNRYITASFDEEAIEGKTAIDDAIAAQMIRTHAIQHGNDDVGNKNLAAIIRALRVVAKRYGIERKLRRISIAGEVVGSDDE